MLLSPSNGESGGLKRVLVITVSVEHSLMFSLSIHAHIGIDD